MRIIKRSVATLLFLPFIFVEAVFDLLMDGNQARNMIRLIWDK